MTAFSSFFFNDAATTEIYTLSLHDALPISAGIGGRTSSSASVVPAPMRVPSMPRGTASATWTSVSARTIPSRRSGTRSVPPASATEPLPRAATAASALGGRRSFTPLLLARRLECPQQLVARDREGPDVRAGGVTDRVRDRRGGRDDRRLAEALGAEVRQVLVRDVDELGDDLGHVGERGHLVGVERLRQHEAGAGVVEPLFRERVADRLDDPALDLTRGAERVDDPADVVDGRDALGPTLASLDVHRHLRDLGAEGEHSHAGRVRAARALAEDLRVLEQARDVLERPRPAVGRDDVAVLHVEDALLEVVALGGDLDDLALRVGCGRADGGTHRRRGRGAGGEGGERAAGGVAELDSHPVERNPELLGRDLRHRRPGAGADVLHRRHDDRAAVGADADPGVRRRPAGAVPDLARHPDAALPRPLGAGANLAPPLPVRLRAPVALHQVLRGVRAVVREIGVGVIATPQLERVELELGRELVEEALEPEGSL